MIIPHPTTQRPRPGEFVLPTQLNLRPGPGTEAIAELLAGYLGADRPRGDDGPVIELRLESGDHGSEWYALDIEPERILLRAHHVAGLRHGVQTLRQLAPAEALRPGATGEGLWRWPCGSIEDEPRLPWRGALLDVARHYLPLDFLFRFVDQLALHKLNVLHLHLTDDQGWRIEIDGLPRLTEVGAWRAETLVGPAPTSTTFDGRPHGGFYTQRQLSSLVGYAQQRGVTVVPEIEMPGHARAVLAAYPQLGNDPGRTLPVWTTWGISEDVLGVHDEVLDFCREVLRQTIGIFPSRYLHIGGDECPTVQWERSPRARARAAELGLAEPGRLHGWFLAQMGRYLAGQGRRAMCWDEAGEDAELPRDMVITAWRDPAFGASAVARGHQVVMAPSEWTYLDYAQTTAPDEPLGQPGRLLTLEQLYAFDPLAGDLPVAHGDAPGVLGAQAQLWTEYAASPQHVEYLAYPRLAAFADLTWSRRPRELAELHGRLDLHQRRLAALGIRGHGLTPARAPA